MLVSIRNAALCALQRQIHRFFPPIAPQFSLAGINNNILDDYCSATEETTTSLEDSLWFAVPKKKVTRGKKRLKTTLQKRIKLKDNIVIDKRTGELTLKHKLPYNWKNYLPGNAEHAPWMRELIYIHRDGRERERVEGMVGNDRASWENMSVYVREQPMVIGLNRGDACFPYRRGWNP